MKQRILYLLLMCLFFCTACFAGYNIHLIGAEYRAGTQVYDSMSQFLTTPEPTLPVPTQTPVAVVTPNPYHEGIDFPQVDFENLEAVNEDVIGWLTIPDTAVNYPLLQGPDNHHYLKYLIDGTRNDSGSIFLDYRNEPDFTDTHNIVYGHHMNNGSMFGSLYLYKYAGHYEKHPYALLMTPEKNYKVEFFAGYVVNASSENSAWHMYFPTRADFDSWVADAISKSTFDSGITPEFGDRLLTLSTCSYETQNARYVLVGVLR